MLSVRIELPVKADVPKRWFGSKSDQNQFIRYQKNHSDWSLTSTTISMSNTKRDWHLMSHQNTGKKLKIKNCFLVGQNASYFLFVGGTWHWLNPKTFYLFFPSISFFSSFFFVFSFFVCSCSFSTITSVTPAAIKPGVR